jgi:H+/Cl- antiporter ClcA
MQSNTINLVITLIIVTVLTTFIVALLEAEIRTLLAWLNRTAKHAWRFMLQVPVYIALIALSLALFLFSIYYKIRGKELY